jgi:quinol monooxygenase YgiN
MTRDHVVVVGLARARPVRADELEERLLGLAARARGEDGCLEYRVHRAASGEGLFVFYEAWRTEEHLRAHLQQPYLAEFMAARMQYLEQDVDTHLLAVLEPAAGAGER